MKKGKIQFITDGKDSQTIISQVEDVVKNGIEWVQFRMKDHKYQDKLIVAKEIKDICNKYNTKFIINDDVQLALELNADGIHLGLDDMNPIEARKILGDKAIIGATCNTIYDIRLRNSQNVDYIGLGPLRFTSTKKNLSPTLGFEGYNKILKTINQEGIKIPIIAIGGIQVEDISPLLELGIHGIAISSLITTSNNRQDVIKKIIRIIN